jgi:hypothetical protein
MKYYNVTETATIIRKRLKNVFPGVKFSVRSSKYSGGASINVSWTDGPSNKMVASIVDQYQSKGFDGMIDMAYHYDHWLMPDGSTIVAHSPGTTGSMGLHEPIENEQPHPDAIRVSFGSCYTFTHRTMSPALKADALRYTARKWGFDPRPHLNDMDGWWRVRIENAGEDLATLVHRTAGDICRIDPSWNIGQSDVWRDAA